MSSQLHGKHQIRWVWCDRETTAEQRTTSLPETSNTLAKITGALMHLEYINTSNSIFPNDDVLTVPFPSAISEQGFQWEQYKHYLCPQNQTLNDTQIEERNRSTQIDHQYLHFHVSLRPRMTVLIRSNLGTCRESRTICSTSGHEFRNPRTAPVDIGSGI